MYHIRLKKSLIGQKRGQIATAHSLGLKKVGQMVTQPVNDATKGKIKKIIHLLEVAEL